MKKEKAGIVCREGHLVEVAFTEEDFLHLWGGGPEDYRDFLLARMERLTHLEEKKGIEPLYHITVPFDSTGRISPPGCPRTRVGRNSGTPSGTGRWRWRGTR